MDLTILEILATILIAFSVIKLFVLMIHPPSWLKFAKGVYGNTLCFQFVALVLSAAVLYYLLQAGITIVQILAVTLFVMLLMGMMMAPHIPRLMKGINAKHLQLRRYWVSALIWIALLVWGIKVIYFP